MTRTTTRNGKAAQTAAETAAETPTRDELLARWAWMASVIEELAGEVERFADDVKASPEFAARVDVAALRAFGSSVVNADTQVLACVPRVISRPT